MYYLLNGWYKMNLILSMFQVEIPIERYESGAIKSVGIRLGGAWFFAIMWLICILLIKNSLL